MLGIVFLSASLFRMFNPAAAILEVNGLGLSGWTAVPVIVVELAIAVSFLTNRFVRHAALVAVVYLAAPICLSIARFPRELYSQLGDLFVFDATATDVVLHLVFLYLLLMLCRERTD